METDGGSRQAPGNLQPRRGGGCRFREARVLVSRVTRPGSKVRACTETCVSSCVQTQHSALTATDAAEQESRSEEAAHGVTPTRWRSGKGEPAGTIKRSVAAKGWAA